MAAVMAASVAISTSAALLWPTREILQPLGLVPDPLGALQPEGSAGGYLRRIAVDHENEEQREHAQAQHEKHPV